MTPMRTEIVTSGGRVFSGREPGSSSLTYCDEAPHIVSLALYVQGLTEVSLPCGRADVATSTDVFEVEPVTRWRAGARQAWAYAGMSGLHPNLALFGKADYSRLYLKVRDTMPGMTLWVEHPARGWHRIQNRQDSRIVIPA